MSTTAKNRRALSFRLDLASGVPVYRQIIDQVLGGMASGTRVGGRGLEVVLSGGTSKGSGDVSHRIIDRLGKPGIIAHGVALKPGKPLCLAVCDGKPVVILPGCPTSAMFTFHDMIVPVLRRMAGLPPRSDAKVTASVPARWAAAVPPIRMTA